MSGRMPQAGLRIAPLVGVAVFAISACSSERAPSEASVPAPRYPKYLINSSIEGLQDAAQVAVRQVYGRVPLGKMQSGQTVHVVITYGQDMRVWDAIKSAWAERGVTALVVGSWELMGMSETAYTEQVRQNLLHGGDAWQELGVFRPQYQPFFPDEVRAEFKNAFTSEVVRRNISTFLDRRPDIHYLYAGTGGGNFWRRAAGERHQHKFMGNWTYVSMLDLLGKSQEFPGDLWNLIDDKVVKPIPHVTEGTFTDPEGTDLAWTLTPEQRLHWSRSSGGNNHLNVYPEHATWTRGTIRASSNHTGFYPGMTVRINEFGRVEKVEGGGKTGDLFRMLVDHPRMRDARFPSAPDSGYWFLSQDGFATNPKYVRDMEALAGGMPNIANLAERNRAGVQHFSFSHPADPDDLRDVAYAESHGLPLDHTAHMHVYFPTIRWRLADTGEWITVADKGTVTAFGDPEVRALAARYGDPELLLRYEWIPAVPGVNVHGAAATEYAEDPWRWLLTEWEQIKSGTYPHYVDDYPRMQRQVTSK